MTPLVLLPVLDPVAAQACVDTMAPEVLPLVLVIDNSEDGFMATDTFLDTIRPAPHTHKRDVRPRRNVGVAGAFNLGRQVALEDDHSHLVWISTSVRFGPTGGLDIERRCEEPHAGFIESRIALHIFAIGREVLETVGEMDCGFGLGYHEDTEYLHRIGLAGFGLASIEIDATVTQDGAAYDILRSLNPGRAVVNFDEQKAFYTRKWGGLPGEEVFTHPYNNPDLPLTYCEPVSLEEVIQRHGLGL